MKHQGPKGLDLCKWYLEFKIVSSEMQTLSTHTAEMPKHKTSITCNNTGTTTVARYVRVSYP